MKHMKAIVSLLAIALTLFFSAEIYAQETVSGELKVYFLNVGQADAIYIECPTKEHHMLIDSGDVSAMRYPGSPGLFRDQFQNLMGGNKNHLNVAVASHPHSDHIGSILWVLEKYMVNTFIDSGMEYDSSTYKKVVAKTQSLFDQGKLKYIRATQIADAKKDADFCLATNVDTVLLVPSGFGQDANPNNNSVVVKLNYNDQTFLFTGDAEEEEEKLLLADRGAGFRS